MDVKETLTRWSRAYMEPSLFYVPAKKNDDEYYNITLHMMIDYFDTVDEKIYTDMTLVKIYNQNYQRISNWRHAKYGSIGQSVGAESVFFVAYDQDGNVADCSLWRDAMSVAEVTETESYDDYNIELYRVTKIPEIQGWSRRVIKNIPNEEAVDNFFTANAELFILTSGDVYIKVFDRYDADAKKSYFKRQKIGKYNYNTDKFRIENEEAYLKYMVTGNTAQWNTHQGTPSSFDNYNPMNTWNSTVPTLRLKKGTYTIKQIVSTQGCELMKPLTITVNGDEVIYYKTTLNGIIQRAEIVDCNDAYHELYDYPDTFSDYYDKWSADGSKSYGSIETIYYTYRLLDNKLIVKQRCTNGYSGAIKVIDGEPKVIDGEMRTNRNVACYGKIGRYLLTVDGYHGNLPYDGNTIISYMFNEPFMSKRPLTKQEIDKIGVFNGNTDHGTDIGPSTTYFYDCVYMLFAIGGWIYNEYDKDPDHLYPEIQSVPTPDEIAATIDKRSLLEWYETRDEEDEYGSHGLIIKDDGHRRWYVFYGGTNYNVYDYHNIDAKQRLMDKTYSSFQSASSINVVLDYYKADDINIDVKNITSKSYIKTYDYNYDYNPDGSTTTDVFYKNYCTFLSAEFNRDEDWNEEIFNNFQTEMRHRLFEEQLK